MSARIMLVDDHALFRAGVKYLLELEGDLVVVAEASHGLEAIKMAQEHQPDLILLDLNMPGMNGMECLQVLSQELPSTPVVILTMSEDGEHLGQSLRLGAKAYLTKHIDREHLAKAIRRVLAGEAVVAENMTAKLVAQFKNQPLGTSQLAALERDRLTGRELDIVKCLARGESNKEIARRLDVAESTVKVHVQNILKKLHLTGRVQVAVYAVEHGLQDE